MVNVLAGRLSSWWFHAYTSGLPVSETIANRSPLPASAKNNSGSNGMYRREADIAAQGEILLDDVVNRPDQAQSVLALDPVALHKQRR